MVTTAEAASPKASDASSRKARGKKTAKRAMTDEHKAALAEGREQTRIVGRYLEALEIHKPKRGRKRTTESVQSRLDKIEIELADASPVKRLELLQEQKDLQVELEAKAPEVDLEALETEFIKVGKAYADRKGIARSTFQSVGVPAGVLKAAGI